MKISVFVVRETATQTVETSAVQRRLSLILAAAAPDANHFLLLVVIPVMVS